MSSGRTQGRYPVSVPGISTRCQYPVSVAGVGSGAGGPEKGGGHVESPEAQVVSPVLGHPGFHSESVFLAADRLARLDREDP